VRKFYEAEIIFEHGENWKIEVEIKIKIKIKVKVEVEGFKGSWVIS